MLKVGGLKEAGFIRFLLCLKCGSIYCAKHLAAFVTPCLMKALGNEHTHRKLHQFPPRARYAGDHESFVSLAGS